LQLFFNHKLHFKFYLILFSSAPPFAHSFCVKKKIPNALEIVQQKFSLNAPKPPQKKGFKTHLKQKKTRKDLQPTKLDFQNSNHLHDLGRNAKGQPVLFRHPAASSRS